MIELIQKILKDRLVYNPDTGIFVWRIRDLKYFKNDRDMNAWNTRYAGKIAGHLNKHHGYWIIVINNKNYRAHRLAWLYINGYMPNELDHVNHMKADNRIINLREVTHLQNSKNKTLHKNNTSGITGVYFNKDKQRWAAQIRSKGKNIHIGYFNTIEEATAERIAAETKHGFHINHGATT